MPGIVAPDRVLRGRYRLTREVAQGGIATVWEARDRVLDRPVAVKVLHAHLAADETFVARFQREAIAAAKLTHPNIVATYDTGSEAGVDFIVMELADEPSLRQLIDERGPLPAATAVDAAAQVADALAYAHAHGVVHRDVTPGTILVRRDGCVKVTDFGIANANDGADATGTGTGPLTPAAYLAPEQIAGHRGDARSDVFALGIVLYELLCGQVPSADDAVPPSRCRPSLPSVIDTIVSRAIASDPADRYATAAEFATALRTSGIEGDDATPAVGTPVVDPPAAVVVPAARRRSRPGVVVTLLIGIAAGLIAMLAVARPHIPLVGPQPAPANNTIALTRAGDFDPFGDGREHPEAAAKAVDGDIGTAWSSQIYRSREFGGIKPGVGLWVELNHATAIRHVEIDAPAGWAGSLYVSDTAAPNLAGWGTPAAAVTATSPHTTVTITHPASGRFLLVWVTRLPGTRISLSEVRVAG